MVSTERIRVRETLFQPSIVGCDSAGLAEACVSLPLCLSLSLRVIGSVWYCSFFHVIARVRNAKNKTMTSIATVDLQSAFLGSIQMRWAG